MDVNLKHTDLVTFWKPLTQAWLTIYHFWKPHTNLNWQLKFRLNVSLGIGDFLSIRTLEITLPNIEIFELCGPDSIKADSQVPFIFLFIHFGSQINSFAKLRLLSAMETGEISSFLWVFYACHEHRIYDKHQSGKRSRWITKKCLLTVTRNRSKREAWILCYPRS